MRKKSFEELVLTGDCVLLQTFNSCPYITTSLTKVFPNLDLAITTIFSEPFFCGYPISVDSKSRNLNTGIYLI